MRILLLVFLILNFHDSPFSQQLKGRIVVYTQFQEGEKRFKLEAFDDTRKMLFFTDSIENNSITVISVEDSLPERWVLLKLEQGKDSVAWAGRFFIKSDEVVQVFFKNFFDDVLVEGGENEFIYANRYLYFDVPSSLTKAKEYNENNLRKSYVFTPRSGYAYSRYLEFSRLVLKKVKDYPDLNYVLTSLDDQRQMLPLQLIDSALTMFSERLKKSEQWANLKRYSERERFIIESGIKPGLKFEDRSGMRISLDEVLSRKEITFIDFWASWCVPCIKQMPELKELFSKVDGNRVQFMSMAIDEEQFKNWNDADKKQQFPWNSYWDKEREIGNFLGISYIPQGVLIDRSGKVLERFVTLDDLRIFLEKQKLLIKK